jgi:hypothetical protein
VVVAGRGRTIVLAASAVLGVRPDDERSVVLAVDPRTVGNESMAEIVRRNAVERPAVTVHLEGRPEPLAGELQACGLDVMALLLAGEPPTPAYLRLASVSEISFASG